MRTRANSLGDPDERVLPSARYVVTGVRPPREAMGLSPAYVEQVFNIIKTINQQGTTIFMVAQNANMALSIVDRVHVLQTDQVVLSDAAAELRQTELIRRAYLAELQVAWFGSFIAIPAVSARILCRV